MTVYVTQELKGRDLSGALSFGELEVLVRANWAVTDESVNEIITDIYDSLDSFNPKKDFLLLSGDPVIIGIAFMALTYIWDEGETFKILRWDRIEERYISITIGER
jgi:hypothetical protein